MPVTWMLVALATLLGTASLLRELARSLRMPAVVGEIAAGVLLGPTVLGRVAPGVAATLFPPHGPLLAFLNGFSTLAAALFLLVAGMEVDLSSVWRQGRTAIGVSLAGVAIPFALTFATAWFVPALLGPEPGQDRLIFALFLATALAISALPVIAKILMDLDLLRTDFGMLVVASAVLQDLIGWMVFAVVLGMMGPADDHALPVHTTILLTLGFAVAMLTGVRWLVHRSLPWIQAHASWPGGVLGFAVTVALLAGAATQAIGVDAIFGTFLAGVAIGDSSHVRARTRATLDQFISFIFAPIFFAGIGLGVDFLGHFDLGLVLFVFALACAGKILGCWLGARVFGAAPRERWALGLAMNARGGMGIILGLLALQAGLIGQRLFVALVIMAVGTSLMSGVLVPRALGRKRAQRFIDFMPAPAFIAPLAVASREEAIARLAGAAAPLVGVPAATIAAEVLDREALMPTGVEGGLAIPHARLPGLTQPCVAAGIVPEGVDFNAPDGSPARLVFLILTPRDDNGAQLEIVADIARTFRRPAAREHALRALTHVEFRAVVRTEEHAA
jgi:Kef-type K+ transport system membrane component KefB/mannitol/fructose-specific phosphotransferase system IIA component (Ntr-type)